MEIILDMKFEKRRKKKKMSIDCNFNPIFVNSAG